LNRSKSNMSMTSLSVRVERETRAVAEFLAERSRPLVTLKIDDLGHLRDWLF